MDKEGIKNILISVRTPENAGIVNNLLGKIDIMDSNEIEKAIAKIGNSEDKIKDFLVRKIEKSNEEQNDSKYPLNAMFTYGISGDCVHLHMPIDLHAQMGEIGPSKTIALVNLYLLDAIDRIMQMRDRGFSGFEGKDNIYMISPALIKKELKFLEGLDFDTRFYQKEELQDQVFLKNSKEARLAVEMFGNEQNVGTAKISFGKVDSAEWQEKRKRVVQKFKDKGISMNESMEEYK